MEEHHEINKGEAADRKAYLAWKSRRDIVLRAIPLDVDLENRELIFHRGFGSKIVPDLETNNIDALISKYVDPKDSKRVTDSLRAATQGQEKPITFQFIHPLTSERLKLEYRYEIVYVKYSSTRLHGVIVNLREPRSKFQGIRKKR